MSELSARYTELPFIIAFDRTILDYARPLFALSQSDQRAQPFITEAWVADAVIRAEEAGTTDGGSINGNTLLGQGIYLEAMRQFAMRRQHQLVIARPDGMVDELPLPITTLPQMAHVRMNASLSRKTMGSLLLMSSEHGIDENVALLNGMKLLRAVVEAPEHSLIRCEGRDVGERRISSFTLLPKPTPSLRRIHGLFQQ